MTRPDVAALAAALRQAEQTNADSMGIIGPAVSGPPPEWYEGYARVAIVALAAQGWRITPAPEHRPGYCDRCGHAVDFHVPPGHQCSECSADDPVSAQAAPGLPAFVVAENYCDDAVRAALEGLRPYLRHEPGCPRNDRRLRKMRGYADECTCGLDARLAALDE